MKIEPRSNVKWRDYQRKLRRGRRLSSLFGKLPRLFAAAFLVFAGAAGLYLAYSFLPFHLIGTEREIDEKAVETAAEPEITISDVLPEVLAGMNFFDPSTLDAVPFELGGFPYLARTSIDTDLQGYALRLLRSSKTVQAAAVVMRPSDGRVLAMASYDESGGMENLCVRSDFPAASIFKIVAAAAALENAGLNPESRMSYEGGRYTLYRRQLTENVGRNATVTNFRRAFALSINPVFGRVGIYDLGREGLSEYAGRFLFNSPIPFDIPMAPSSIEIPEDDFGLAEVASGFNRTTLISPLHAAMISAAIVNDGVIMSPRLLDSVIDGQGEVVHVAEPRALAEAVSPETAEGLRILMRETVISGTGRGSLAKLLRSNVYRGIELGAKTGSINDATGRFRLDWVTTYAIPEDGRDPVVVAVLGVNGPLMGARAGDMSRLLIARHYS